MQSEQVDCMAQSGLTIISLTTADRPALEVIQTNKTQIGLNKQIKHKLKPLKHIQHKLIFAKQSIIKINIFN